MAGKTFTGPMCQLSNTPHHLNDGTLCRCESPLPGPLGSEPWMLDHIWPGNAGSASMAEEKWFEQRYPNLLEEVRQRFINTINTWVQGNWGQSPFNDASPRISVHGRNKYEGKNTAAWTDRMLRDNLFEGCGDKPQSFHEADAVLGSFSLDFETPVTITYTRKTVQGKMVDAFEWTTSMYVQDILGLQAHDPLAKVPGALFLAPSRRVKRATWEIRGEGVKVS